MLREPVQRLFAQLRVMESGSDDRTREDSVINIHSLTGRAGTLYEKLRYLVDYKEEKHIRRSAIERIIKRKIVFEGESERIGRSLIEELIAGGYLANNTISEYAPARIDSIIQKHRVLQRLMPASFQHTPLARHFFVSLLGSEIESFFYPSREDDLIAETFAARIADAVQSNAQVSESMREWQILLSCYRGLYNADDNALRFVFWMKLYPQWRMLSSEADIAAVAESSVGVIRSIEAAFNHPFGFKLLPRLGNFAIYFSLLREVVRAYGAEAERVLSDRELLSRFAGDFLGKQYQRQHERTRQSALRAVCYVFLTKILLAVALEIPYAVYVLGTFHYVPIVINSVIHPLFLFATTLSVRPLSKKNTEAILAGLEEVVSQAPLRPIRIKAKGSGFLYGAFVFLYGALFVVVFSAVVAALQAFGFDVVNIALFLVFLALVSFFALRIRHSANKWRVRLEDNRVSMLLFTIFTLPIIRAGKWLSRTFSSINVFVFVMDFIIETPFKFLLKFSDAFMTFLKDKQEDVY